jgi:hypothetical protein
MANPFINKNVTIYNPHPKALSFDIAGSILRIELVDMTQKTSRFNTNSVRWDNIIFANSSFIIEVVDRM